MPGKIRSLNWLMTYESEYNLISNTDLTKINSEIHHLVLILENEKNSFQICRKEAKTTRLIGYIQAIITSLMIISKMALFLSLTSYIFLGNAITARKVFIVLSYFNTLSLSMVTVWPISIIYA